MTLERITRLVRERNHWREAWQEADERALHWKWEAVAAKKRAEAAEAHLKDVDGDRWKLLLRAEDADAEVHDLQVRAEKAEARVRELEKTHAPDTFTAPDGRVFRVGQRVWCTAEREYGTVASLSGSVARIDYPLDRATSSLSNLRRVWDGSEEPDVELATVLKDGYDWYLLKSEGGWRLWSPAQRKWSEEVIKWEDVHWEDYAPYVEWLEGDE